MNFLISFLVSLWIFGCSTTSTIQKTNSEHRTHTSPKQAEDEVLQTEKIKSIGNFPVVWNEDVKQWVNYFQSTAKRSFTQWTQRGEPFRSAIQDSLESEGVPGAFYYMSLIESGFVHHARSTGKASGPWQFIKETGERYGLVSNRWVDERRDPVKSTHAAAAYLRDLKKLFGDWYLALAAYNGGPRTIRDAMKKAGSQDFWEIKKAGLLKKETGDFVPKMIAAAIVGSNPKSFGFPETVINPKSAFPKFTIALKKPEKISVLAKKLSLPLAKLKEWNPELLKNTTPPHTSKPYLLRVDENHAEIFAKLGMQLTKLKKKRKRHHLRKGKLSARVHDGAAHADQT